MLGRGMMEDGGRVWSLVPGGEVTEPCGAADQNKQADNQRLTAPSRADNETGTDLVEPAPSLEGPETQPASHEEVCAMLLLQQEIV